MPERPLRSSVLAILRAMPLSRLPKIANSTPEILFIAVDFRQARNVNDQASRVGKATGRTWVDDHGGERGFNDEWPRHTLANLHLSQMANRRFEVPLGTEIDFPAGTIPWARVFPSTAESGKSGVAEPTGRARVPANYLDA